MPGHSPLKQDVFKALNTVCALYKICMHTAHMGSLMTLIFSMWFFLLRFQLISKSVGGLLCLLALLVSAHTHKAKSIVCRNKDYEISQLYQLTKTCLYKQ